MKAVRIRASGLLVKDDRLLLVRHEKAGRTYYLLPGGGVDGKESIPDALIREFEEELGIRVDFGPLVLMAQTLAPDRERNILHLVFRVSSQDEPSHTGNDQRVTGFKWYCLNSREQVAFYPDILPRILELAGNPTYNGMELELPDWLE